MLLLYVVIVIQKHTVETEVYLSSVTSYEFYIICLEITQQYKDL